MEYGVSCGILDGELATVTTSSGSCCRRFLLVLAGVVVFWRCVGR